LNSFYFHYLKVHYLKVVVIQFDFSKAAVLESSGNSINISLGYLCLGVMAIELPPFSNGGEEDYLMR